MSMQTIELCLPEAFGHEHPCGTSNVTCIMKLVGGTKHRETPMFAAFPAPTKAHHEIGWGHKAPGTSDLTLRSELDFRSHQILRSPALRIPTHPTHPNS